MSRFLVRTFVAVAGFAGGSRAFAQSAPDYERPPVSYSTATPRDAAARLQLRLESGELKLEGSEGEVLRAMLAALHVPVESQVVVFSKTSLQRGRIRPSRPRALYFSDSVYVGWVPGGLIEVAAIDPQLGPVFYSFDPQAERGATREFVRESDCLRCHGGTFVREVPGLFARSLVPDATGEPLLRHGTEIVTDETPFARRWGGWYVTGYTGKENHRGNVFGSEKDDQLVFDLSAQRPLRLDELFDVRPYPTNTSDVVALLVFEHQMAMQNSLTRANHSCRRMLDYQASLQRAFKEPVTDEPSYDSVKSVFASAVEDVVDRLLFRDAAPLPEGLEGSEAFRTAFQREALRSREGLALKDLSLNGKLFAQRCSYLIYTEAFTALPRPLKQRIFERLHAALQDGGPKGRYAYLDQDERARIAAILRETHPEAKTFWPEESEGGSAP